MKADGAKFAGFEEFVTSADDISAVMGKPSQRVLLKVSDHVDDFARGFIAKSPFLVIGSLAEGHVDLSPKGDPAGFVKVLDDKHLAIPDRLGNRRADTFRNVLENPKVGLIFLIPGKPETLRISGEARIVRDQGLRESMAVAGRLPDFAMVVFVERVLMHCAKCMLRSKLWQPEAWPDHAGTPSMAEMMVKSGGLEFTTGEMQAIIDKSQRERLY